MSELDIVSQAILSLISLFDSVGAERWNLNLVAVTTTATILLVKTRLGKLHGVDWYAFMHAVITGVGSCLCLYLDIFSYDSLRQGMTRHAFDLATLRKIAHITITSL
jgi:hypothetical protein